MKRQMTTLALVALAAVTPSSVAAAKHAETQTSSASTHVLFRFHDDQIKESSGLETSVNFRRILYTHNDSGDDARFFAVGSGGRTKAIYTLDGAGSWDWEDMSAGPHKTLWFGDIGANQLGRDYISAYKVREPKKLKSHQVAWTRYDFKYDDGQSHNAEALLVNPITGALFVVTKGDTGGAVYRSSTPLRTTGYNTLNRVASAPIKVTGGDFSPNGKRLVIRTYGKAYFYSRIGGKAKVMDLPSSGESITFARYSAGIIIGSEGVHSAVWQVVRRRG